MFSKKVVVVPFLGIFFSMLSACSASTSDCQCTTNNGDASTVTEFYDMEGSCSELEDSDDMSCTEKE